ncbi:MAG TPA: TetR/AcrR family transcriptional regulator [Jatrophihabitans sp.]|nr:TetR/AcrR family transcriptional regulator [Jatrophihabitans sp.]
MGGPDGSSQRGPGRGLSVERIVAQTLELIDEQGIGAASMRTVGERLGVRGMSLYRYVSSREELFDAVVERIVDELTADPEVEMHPVAGWRDYLTRLAGGVRRYAKAHPHAFPLVATRPPGAPWINPPLRSLRWIEGVLTGLRDEGFTDEQVLFAYRTFNSFLLGFLLLETSATALRDPKPGDGSFQQGSPADGTDPVDPADPVPGGLSPARSRDHREQLAAAERPGEQIDPVGEVDASSYPNIHRLAAGLTEEHYEAEFTSGLEDMLDRIERQLGTGRPARARPRRAAGKTRRGQARSG